MSSWLYRIGLFSARRPFVVVGLWLAVAVAVVLMNQTMGGTVENYAVPGVESEAASDLLQERFPDRAGATATVVFHVAEGSVSAPDSAGGIAATVAEVRALPEVLAVTEPLEGAGTISPDGATAYATVQFEGTAAELGTAALDDLLDTAAPAEAAGVQVEYGGELPTTLSERSSGAAEAIGVVAALIILLITFRSLLSMALPIATALAGIVVGLSLVGVLGGVIDVPSMASRLGVMIGLGVGIDYALFVLSRHRDQLRSGIAVEESIARTNASAGQAVVIAGGTVVVALFGLQLAGIPFVAAVGYSASLVVAVAVAVAVTLLPALLGRAGPRVLGRSERIDPASATVPVDGGRDGDGPSGWARRARRVTDRPWPAAIIATVVLLVLAIPVTDMRLGQADAGTNPTSTTQRRAYDLLAAGFGEGVNGPLLLAIDLVGSSDPAADADAVARAVAGDPGVAATSPPQLNPAGDASVLTAVPTTEPQASATTELVHRLRDTTLPEATAGTGATVLVGGPTAGFIDQSDKIAGRLPWFIAGVVAVSFLLLMAVFRSVLVALKAALLNLLSIGAAYGVVVAVFQWGWGRSLIGLDEAVPIASFVPMMMFAILFGLSMDYEVFILSRIREEYRRGRTNVDSVVVGLGATAKVITAAALIMVSVFLGFVASDDPVVKMMGVGLATAVAVDATIVRMLLLPATMTLVGDANWWLPRWLARLLPRLDIEAGPPTRQAQR